MASELTPPKESEKWGDTPYTRQFRRVKNKTALWTKTSETRLTCSSKVEKPTHALHYDIVRLFKFDDVALQSLFIANKAPDASGVNQSRISSAKWSTQRARSRPHTSQLWPIVDLNTLEKKVVKVISKTRLPLSSTGENVWRRLCERLLEITPLHRGLMHISDVIETPSRFYLFSEKLEGGELFDFLLHETAIPEELCKYIIRQILEAVKFLHHHNLLHRDIKPENLVLRYPRVHCLQEGSPPLSCLECSRYMTPQQMAAHYEIALIDFDTCRLMDMVGGRRRLVGTYGYLAPEVLLGYAYTHVSDLWSVGVILYILMTGFPPAPMDLMVNVRSTLQVLQETKKKKINFDAPPFAHFPLARELCQKLLEFDPERRISSAHDALMHPWLYPIRSAGIRSEEC